jgi:hypothetical protein
VKLPVLLADDVPVTVIVDVEVKEVEPVFV